MNVHAQVASATCRFEVAFSAMHRLGLQIMMMMMMMMMMMT